MSSLEEELVRQEMEESGELQFIRDWANQIQTDDAPEAPAADPVDTADTSTTPDEPTQEADTADDVDTPDEVDTPDDAPVAEPTDEEVVDYLDLDDDTLQIIDTKYGGDINAFIRGAREAMSTVGRQGNDIGELKRQIEELRGDVKTSIQRAEPYPDWPDEDYEPHEAVIQYRAIAEAAFDRQDEGTFKQAFETWMATDPVGAMNYRDLKVLQLQTQAAPSAQQQEQDVTALTAKLAEEFPDLKKPEVQREIAALTQARPTLGVLLEQATPVERVQILKDLYLEVASRTQSDTLRQAQRRVAIRTSEEARQARLEARVESQGNRGRTAADEPKPREVKIGKTDKTFSFDRLNELLPPEDRV